MQVLLPDFAMNPLEQTGIPFKHSKKALYNSRARTVQVKSSKIFFNQRKNRQKSQALLRKSHLSIFIPFSLGQQQILKPKKLSYDQFATVNFQNVFREQPIHSRKSTRFFHTSSLSKRKINSKKDQSKQRQKLFALQFSFLKAQRLISKKKILKNPQIQKQIVQKPRQVQNYINKFPTKKIRSMLIAQQYRPWSPKKGQLILDEINQ